jgi:MFS family permease
MSNPRLSAPLRRKAFRRLAASFAVNEMGDWLGLIALSVLVFEKTGSALATTALFLGTGILPALLTPILVARFERPPPRLVLPSIYGAEAAAFGALAVLAHNFSLPVVVVLAAIDGALALTAKTIARAVTAAMLERDGELRAGNAILNVAFTGGSAVGPAAAGAIVAASSVQTALFLDAASFYLIAWMLFTAGPLPQAEPEPGHLREQVRAGLDYIRGHVTLRRLIGAEAAALVFFSAVVPIEVVYAKETLGAGDTGYGILLASWGLGMVAGSVVFATVRRSSLPAQLFFSTIAIVACVASVVGGTGNGIQWVAVISAVQELTASRMQARVLSVLESISAALPALGFVIGGLITDLRDPRATFAFAGIGVVLVVAVAAPLLGRRWPVQTARESDSDAEDAVMVELIPAMPAEGVAGPTWRYR